METVESAVLTQSAGSLHCCPGGDVIIALALFLHGSLNLLIYAKGVEVNHMVCVSKMLYYVILPRNLWQHQYSDTM